MNRKELISLIGNCLFNGTGKWVGKDYLRKSFSLNEVKQFELQHVINQNGNVITAILKDNTRFTILSKDNKKRSKLRKAILEDGKLIERGCNCGTYVRKWYVKVLGFENEK